MKKPNPKDATLRNTQAANKKIAELEKDVRWLRLRVKRLTKIINRRFDLNIK